MKEKNLKSKNQYTTFEWIAAYQEKVREILHYQGFEIKPSSSKIFKKLCGMYPSVSPYTFMESVFDPNIWWGYPDKKGGWKKIKYPFPNMLISKKAKEAYEKYIKDRKPEKSDKQDEILRGVLTSLDKISTLGIQLTNLRELYYLSADGTISPYIFASLDNSYSWLVLQCNKGETDMEWARELDKVDRYLSENLGLKNKIKEMLKDYSETN